LALAASSGHAAGAPDEQKTILGEPKPNQALIYIIREPGVSGYRGRRDRIYIEDQLAGVLRDKTYTLTYASPGLHLLWRSGWFRKSGLVLDVAGGQTYYVVFKGIEDMSLVSEAEGKAALAKVKSYSAIGESDRSEGRKEGAEKWPEFREEYASSLALGSGDRIYVPPASKDGMILLPANTPIPVELMETLSSRLAIVGDPVWLRTTDDVSIDGKIVVQKGTVVNAAIRNMTKPRGLGKGALLNVAMLSVSTVDGTSCPLIGQVVDRGTTTSTVGAQLALGAGGAFLTATAENVGFALPYAQLALGAGGAFLTKGEHSHIRAGETVTGSTRHDVWVKPAERASWDAGAVNGAPGALKASIDGPVACKIPMAKGPRAVRVLFDSPDQFASVQMVRVAGSDLPTPLSALRIVRSATGLRAEFDGWQICRYLRPTPEATSVRQKDGTTRTYRPNVETPLMFRLIGKDGRSKMAEAPARELLAILAK
jgi:hypothetical protein